MVLPGIMGGILLGQKPAGGPANFWFGKIGEVIAYRNALTGQDLADLKSYLSGKWT